MYSFDSPTKIHKIFVKNDNSFLMIGEDKTFTIDISDNCQWKIREITQDVEHISAMKTILKNNEANKQLTLFSSPEFYASLISGSFNCDSKLFVSGYPRNDSVSMDSEKTCISSFNEQIINFVHSVSKFENKNNNGFLEVVNLKDSTYSYIEIGLPYNVSSFASWLVDTSNPYLLMCLTNDGKLFTTDIKGCVKIWEVNQHKIEQSFKEWKNIIGADSKQLTIERIDKKELTAPKHGKVDPTGAPHVGGNTWAGGTGGRDTAGLGGRGGPYRLDAGHNVFQVSDQLKAAVPPEVREAARKMGRKAYQEKLKEIQMSEYDAELYENFLSTVEKQILSLRVILESLQAKSKERQWLKHQTSGDLDDTKLVEGITGEKSIYRKRGLQDPEIGSSQEKPKLLRLVIDVSGSMYRFNGHDDRLQRELESVVLLMEAFENSGEKFKYEIVGHSGEEFCLEFSTFDKIPKNRKERLQLLRSMIAHSQFCVSGDHTLEATEHAIKTITKEDADEYFVIVMSDANFDRYGISPTSFAQLLVSEPKVNAFAIFIGSLGNQATLLHKQLPAGRAFVCFDSSQLIQILQNIFTSALLRDS